MRDRLHRIVDLQSHSRARAVRRLDISQYVAHVIARNCIVERRVLARRVGLRAEQGRVRAIEWIELLHQLLDLRLFVSELVAGIETFRIERLYFVLQLALQLPNFRVDLRRRS